jgi:3-oxoacyl-[acyl-carrier protein] reductase
MIDDRQPAALVFGGSRGIGAAVVRRLAADGFAVAFTYVSRPHTAKDLVADVESRGGTAVAIDADSADPAAIRGAVARAAQELGDLSAVVVNAGIMRRGTVEEFPLEDLDLMLDVNVRGVFLAIQAAVPHLLDGARVVTVGSNTAIRTGTVGSSVYQLTKTALVGLVKGVALDLAPRRITVNNIQPGPTETDMAAASLDVLAAASPQKRVGSPDEIAALISFLVGPESGYITGASLTIDGGFTL